jgi:predicted enzyme related to lactoylglutathione lyase
VGSAAGRRCGLWLVLAVSAGSGACRRETSAARPAGGFVWHELVASDPEAEAAFYADVVGWRVTRDPGAHLTLAGDFGDVAGISPLPAALQASGMTPRWIARVGVEDVDATVAKTRLSGGQVALEPMDLPDFRFAILEDPAGAPLQIASPHEPGPVGNHHRPSEFSWDELATPDGPGMLEFYSKVLGWKALLGTPIRDKVTYFTLGRGETPMAGLFADPSLRHQQWLSYVEVRDLDLALSKARQRGATILVGPEEVPDGRMAQVKDPEGAIFGLREPSNEIPH